MTAEIRKVLSCIGIPQLLMLVFGLTCPVTASSSEEAKISQAQRRKDGVLTHSVTSPYQNGNTAIRVLLPDLMEQGKRYPVVYVLPVEPDRETRWGDGLAEVLTHDLHNQHRVIFVAPTFSQLPWYANHSANLHVRQEAYFTEVVVPFVEQTYAASQEANDRLLLGFSKSGWGAWSLLLRHPHTFGRAAAWDAPLMMDRLGKYGSSDIFGTQENFEAYRIVALLEKNAELLRKERRLVLTGYGNFEEHHRQMHLFLDEMKILHEYRDGPKRNHDWNSGWMAQTVELLVGTSLEAMPQEP